MYATLNNYILKLDIYHFQKITVTQLMLYQSIDNLWNMFVYILQHMLLWLWNFFFTFVLIVWILFSIDVKWGLFLLIIF